MRRPLPGYGSGALPYQRIDAAREADDQYASIETMEEGDVVDRLSGALKSTSGAHELSSVLEWVPFAFEPELKYLTYGNKRRKRELLSRSAFKSLVELFENDTTLDTHRESIFNILSSLLKSTENAVDDATAERVFCLCFSCVNNERLSVSALRAASSLLRYPLPAFVVNTLIADQSDTMLTALLSQTSTTKAYFVLKILSCLIQGLSFVLSNTILVSILSRTALPSLGSLKTQLSGGDCASSRCRNVSTGRWFGSKRSKNEAMWRPEEWWSRSYVNRIASADLSLFYKIFDSIGGGGFEMEWVLQCLLHILPDYSDSQQKLWQDAEIVARMNALAGPFFPARIQIAAVRCLLYGVQKEEVLKSCLLSLLRCCRCTEDQQRRAEAVGLLSLALSLRDTPSQDEDSRYLKEMFLCVLPTASSSSENPSVDASNALLVISQLLLNSEHSRASVQSSQVNAAASREVIVACSSCTQPIGAPSEDNIRQQALR
uniref:HEAT repeat-containing protein 1 n=1 Tax=Ascaris lumbricoides TaxID=6252 RepID=A0A9J2P488_ASCLU